MKYKMSLILFAAVAASATPSTGALAAEKSIRVRANISGDVTEVKTLRSNEMETDLKDDKKNRRSNAASRTPSKADTKTRK